MNTTTIRIAVDALGGDNAPDVVLDGCAQALEEMAGLEILLCGPAEVVGPFADAHERVTPIETTQAITMDEHPANAVRKKKDSSLVVGCRMVKEGRAQGFFSAGSTGACLAAATLVIGRVKGVQRPALAVIVPTPGKDVLLLDVGANADVKPGYLLQFAKMGSIFMRRICGVEDPRVGLLNIGEEETKGSALAQECHAVLKEGFPGFAGNAEGRDIMEGNYDVIVTDGFTGNVALKTIEGTFKLVIGELKSILKSSLKTKLAALAIKPGLKGLLVSLDPDAYGGSPLLGVKGACLVGHGSSNARAVKNGILTAVRFVEAGLIEDIEAAFDESEADTPKEERSETGTGDSA